MSADEMKPSSERYNRFAEEFIVDLNATKAAERTGYSKRSAYSQGQRLLKNDEVLALIREKIRERSDRTGVTADRVLEELSLIAFSDIGDAFADKGSLKLKSLGDMPPRVRRAIESVSEKQGKAKGPRERTVKMHSKISALRMLMDHLGMSAPTKVEGKHEHSGPDGKPMESTTTHRITPEQAEDLKLNFLGIDRETLEWGRRQQAKAEQLEEPEEEERENSQS